ncbi:MAG: macro domain-containing protein [Chloroflexi bacterium]|nr:macro domain-containing protein [Chloroflexota bacterium]
MVTTVSGDLLESKAQTLVNAVNCQGVMGKGIALQFKKRFPAMFADYAAQCDRSEVKLGEPYIFKSASGPWILNFPTKNHWRDRSYLKDIVKGLEYLLAYYREMGISSMAVPALGCGAGGLEWEEVGPVLYEYLGKMAIPVELYAPVETNLR